MTLTHGALCAGYGGTGMAAAAALGPLDTRWHCDFKAESIDLLNHYHPDARIYGDLTRVDWSQAEPVDVITVSWPCQPHSPAGKRLGSEDPRAIWPNVLRIVDTMRPRILLGENVARIASNGELRRVVRSLAEIGYVGAWRCLTASAVGACHKRDRCFLVAIDAATDPLGLDLRHESGRSSGPRGEGAGIADHDGDAGPLRMRLLPTPTMNMTTGPGRQGRDGGMNLQTAAVTLFPTPTVRDGRRGAGWGNEPGRPLSETIHRVSPLSWGEYEPAIRQWERVFGRPAPMPTQPSLRPPHGPQLAPRFVEWMMGLPDGWVTDVPNLTRNEQLSLLGDGVVPQQGAAAYRELLGYFTQEAIA